MQRPDGCCIDLCQFFLQVSVLRIIFKGLLQSVSDTFLHFRCSCLGEGDHQNFQKRGFLLWINQLLHTAVDQSACFTRARSCNYQDISLGVYRFFLCWRVFHASFPSLDSP